MQTFLARAKQICALNATQVQAKYGVDSKAWSQCNDMLFEYQMMKNLGLSDSTKYQFLKSTQDGDDTVDSEWALGVALAQISA